VGGVVVGLAGVPPNNGPETDGKFVVEDTNQDTLNIPQNGPFTFAHPYALNDSYQISVLHTASTQPQYCTLWDYKGVVTMNVTGIVVDCAHDDWTWIDGGKTAGTVAKPIYGTFPTSAPTTIPNPYANTPGARYGSSGWTDKFGNLWLFGGNGWELAGNTAPDTLDLPMNDMWVCIWDGDGCQWQLAGGYDPTTVGTSTVGAAIIANAQFEGQTGVFPGAPLAPEARVGAASWTDTAKNFWLFGGRTPGAHFRNDLWKFDLSAYNGGNYTTAVGQWTQVGGTSSLDQPGVYTGAVGSLVPGARVNAVYWTDANGNFWMFGGYGFDVNGNIGYLNDLWEYTGGNWVWKSSAPTNTVNQNGIYGQPGTPGTPGGRQEAIGWADSNGNLWLFGGEGEDSVGTANGILDDFWVYSIANNQWTFVMGSTAANQTGSYASQTVVGPVSTTGAASTCGLSVGLVSGGNTLCSPVSITGNFPGSRIGASGWIDAGGNLWLFGGWGLDSTATNGNGALNDLWVYTPSSTPTQAGTWAWVKGSNTGSPNGIYGDELRGYKTYYIWTPGGRSNATSWVDNHGQFWLFGGEGYDSTDTNGNGYLNDTWRYLPYQDY
jgi:hypothetical protein